MWVKILFKLNKFSGWILLILIVLFIISGYGMTNQIIDPVFARYLHSQVLPIPFYIFLGLHLILPLKRLFQKFFQRRKQ